MTRPLTNTAALRQLERAISAARRVHSRLSRQTEPCRLTTGQRRLLRRIVRAVCAEFDLPASVIYAANRTEPGASMRFLAMTMIREQLRLPYADISRIFGRVDHNAALHAVRSVYDRLTVDQQLARRFQRIKQEVLK